MSNRSRYLIAAGSVAALIACAAPAQAATVVFDTITSTWSAASGANVSTNGNGTPTSSASWGTPAERNGKKSSYSFASISPVNAVIGAPGDYGPFQIGTFTHNNWPITGDSITSIKLSISTKIIIDGISQGIRTFDYMFSHLETPNDVPGYNGTCANGQKENANINSNGCADRVKVNFLNTSEMFNVDGNLYTLDITGFLNAGQPVTDFWTKEEKSNSAQLLASIKMVGSAVPEPSTWAMMILGFGLAGTAVRTARRQKEMLVA